MYRQKQREMSTLEPEEDQHFLSRCTSYPVIVTAMEQVAGLYDKTKESNRLIKYTLEKAETGVKVAAQTAAPVVNKLEKPISGLDNFACNQLDKLEKVYPTIKKPTEEVVDDAKTVYNNNLKPTVDRIGGVYTYGKDTVTGVTNYGCEKVDAIKTFSKNQVDSAVQYGTSTINGATTGVKKSVDAALHTPYGLKVLSGVNVLLDTADDYVDKYLPDQQEKAKSDEDAEEPMEVDHIDNEPTTVTLNKVASLSDKMRRRMYSRAMKDLRNMQLRSKETIEKLNFTVDLMEYARDNIDNAKSKVGSGVSATRDRLNFYWSELNKTGTELEMEDFTADKKDEEENAQITPTMLERRALATARHLSLQLQTALGSVSSHVQTAIPENVKQRFTDAKVYSEDMYTQLIKAQNVQDLSKQVMDQTRDKLSYIKETLSSLVETYNPLTWMSPVKDEEISWEDDDEDEKPSDPDQPGFEGYSPHKKSD